MAEKKKKNWNRLQTLLDLVFWSIPKDHLHKLKAMFPRWIPGARHT